MGIGFRGACCLQGALLRDARIWIETDQCASDLNSLGLLGF
jgi:hypothetical protein